MHLNRLRVLLRLWAFRPMVLTSLPLLAPLSYPVTLRRLNRPALAERYVKLR